MTVNDLVRTIAGLGIIVSMALGIDCGSNPLFVHKYFLFITLFIGLNLFQSGFTKFCLLAIVLKKLGVPTHRCQHS